MGDAGISAEDLERAAMTVLDPTFAAGPHGVDVEKANDMCQAVHDEPGEFWPLSLQLLQDTAHSMVRFFCLQVVEEMFTSGVYEGLEPGQRAAVREALAGWLISADEAAALDDEAPFVLNKLALVFVLAIKVDYPHGWPSAFDDLLETLGSSPSLILFYQRVLNILDEEVVAYNISRGKEELERNTQIKDAMRVEGCVDALVELWLSSVETYGESAPNVAEQCLDTMCKYIGWIAIDLVTSDRAVALFFDLVRHAGLRGSACRCIDALVNKKMDGGAKLELLRGLGVVDVVEAIEFPDADSEDNVDEDFFQAAAKLVSDVGGELLKCWQFFGRPHSSSAGSDAEAAVFAGEQSRRAIQLALSILQNCDRDVALQVFPLVDEILALLRKEHDRQPASRGDLTSRDDSAGYRTRSRALSGAHTSPGAYSASPQRPAHDNMGLTISEFSPQLLEIAAMRMSYPPDWFDYSEEEQAVFETTFRAKLRKVFVNTTRVHAQSTLDFIGATFGPKIDDCGMLEFQDAELMLTLIYLFGEAVPVLVDEQTSDGGTVFELMCAIHEGSVALHENHLVLLAYFEMTVRYAKVLHARPDLFPHVLGTMMGDSGLRCGHPQVRGRAAYLLLRLVKSFGDIEELASKLSEGILEGLEEFLPIDFATSLGGSEGESAASLLSADDQGYLYEVVGLVIGANWMDPESRARMLSSVFQPLLDQLQEGLSRVRRASEDAVAGASEFMCRLLGAFGNVMKGLKPASATDASIAELLENVLNGAMEAATLLPSTEVRTQVYFLMHRSVECLGSRIIDSLNPIIELFLSSASTQSLPPLLTLVNQAIAAFGSEMAPVVERQLLPITNRVFEIMPDRTHERADESLERLQVQKSYFQFLQQLALPLNDLTAVLTSDTCSEYLGELLGTIVDGAVSIPDPNIRKCNFATLRHLVDSWVPPGRDGAPHAVLVDEGLEWFITFVWDRIAPAIFETAMTEDFNLADAQYARTLVGEIVHLQAMLTSRLHGAGDTPDFLQHVATSVLPTLGCPPATSEAYCQEVQDALSNPKRLQLGYRRLVTEMREALAD